MFKFPLGFKKDSIALLIEIGSAKATLSLVKYSDDTVDFLWFTEQTASYKGSTSKEQRKKALISTLTNLLLTLNSEALPFLHKNYKGYSINEVQVSVSAPWSYVLLKKIQLTADDTVHLSKESLQDLVSEIEYTKSDDGSPKSLANLKEVSKTVLQVRLNDYVYDEISDFDAETAEIDVAISLIETSLYESLYDVIEKILPKASIHTTSSLVVLTQAMKLYDSDLSEYTFINLTMEATEIAVVRNGTISFINFNNYGILSLARDIEEATSIPYSSVVNYIQTSTMTDLISSLSEEKQNKVEKAISAFISNTNLLFDKLDDGYLLSKTVYLHTPICTCNYIKNLIERSLTTQSQDKHSVIDIDKKFNKYLEPFQGKKYTSIYPCSVMFASTFFHKIKRK